MPKQFEVAPRRSGKTAKLEADLAALTLTTKETAAALGVSVARVHQMQDEGKLTPALKQNGLRGCKFFAFADVGKLVEEMKK